MYEYARRLGFGQRTGLPLPAESAGKLRTLDKWGTTSLASISMGQEVSVTSIQLARLGAVIANGGLLVQPRLVMKMGDQAPPMEPPVRAIKPETAITMRQMMEAVVLYGTGKTARLAGYTTGGKTGTAQIFDFASKRYTHTYNGSFMGFAPVTNPAVIAVVTLNGTRGNLGFGAEVAIPTWKAVVAEALRILDVPKDLPDTPDTPAQIAQNQKDAGANDLAIAGLGGDRPNILEDTDDDEAAAPRTIAFVGPIAPAPPTPAVPVAGTVPNFKGMTLRAVLTAAAAKGLPIQPNGTGIARVQSPPPGAVLHQGERIRVQFAR
jgi:membrane peptidoglycan carboxypeptidase